MLTRYQSVQDRGRNTHDPYDPFYSKHPPMDLTKRAKIFAPFDALRGFKEEIASKEIPYVRKRELDESEKEQLNRTLQMIKKQLPFHAHVTYFVPAQNSPDYGLYQELDATILSLTSTSIRTDVIEIDFHDILELSGGN